VKSTKPKQLIKLLEKNGFVFVRQKGNHRLYKKENLRVTIPFHSKDLKPGTLAAILKEAGIAKEEL